MIEEHYLIFILSNFMIVNKDVIFLVSPKLCYFILFYLHIVNFVLFSWNEFYIHDNTTFLEYLSFFIFYCFMYLCALEKKLNMFLSVKFKYILELVFL